MKHRRSVALAPKVHGRTITVRLVAWDTPSRVTDDHGRTWYREAYARGGARLGRGRLVARTEHDGAIVGTIDPDTAEDRDDGLYADVRLRDTSAARDLLALLDDELDDGPVIDAVSIEFDSPRPPTGDVVYRNGEAVITGVAFVPDPQHPASQVVAIRSRQGATPMDPDTDIIDDQLDDQLDDQADDQLDDQLDDVDDADDQAVDDQLVGARRSRRQAPPARRERSLRRPGNGGGTGQYPTFGHFARAVFEASQRGRIDDPQLRAIARSLRHVGRHRRALADGVTGDMTSVVRDSWVNDIIDLVANVTPTINAFGSRPLPATGMTVNQPAVTQRPQVGKQATQKTEIASRKMLIGLVPWAVETYAGGNDLAVQLLERADIDVLNEYMRYFVIEMGQELNSAAVASVLAAADDVNPEVEILDDDNGVPDFNAAVITASKPILTALHRLPNVCLLSVDLWEVLGNAKDTTGRPLYPGISPTNPVGSFDVTSTSGNVRGLNYVVEPELLGKSAVVGLSDAWVSRRSGIKTLTADVPSKLGRDVAVYEYAAMGVVDARGLSLIVDEVDEPEA